MSINTSGPIRPSTSGTGGGAATTYKSGSTTWSGNTTGTQTITHSLGKTPTRVRLTCIQKNASVGVAMSVGVKDSSGESCTAFTQQTAGGHDHVISSRIAYVSKGAAGFLYTDGCTLGVNTMNITWAKVGTPVAETIQMLWEVEA